MPCRKCIEQTLLGRKVKFHLCFLFVFPDIYIYVPLLKVFDYFRVCAVIDALYPARWCIIYGFRLLHYVMIFFLLLLPKSLYRCLRRSVLHVYHRFIFFFASTPWNVKHYLNLTCTEYVIFFLYMLRDWCLYFISYLMQTGKFVSVEMCRFLLIWTCFMILKREG